MKENQPAAMASPQNAIVINDDEDGAGLSVSRRARSLSVVSSASSHTLRAESQDAEEIPNIKRSSVQPSLGPDFSLSHVFDDRSNRKRQRSVECVDKDEFRRSHRAPLNDGIRRQVIDLEEDDVKIPTYNEKEDEIIDIDELEPKLEEEVFRERPISRGRKAAQRTEALRTRNAPVVLPYVVIDVYKWKSSWNSKNQAQAEVSLKDGKTVELNDGSFLEIATIIQNLETEEVTIRGWKLKRTRELQGFLNKKINEVAFIFEVDLDDPRPYLEQSVEEVVLKDVRQIRKLVRTNRPFPECRFDINYVLGTTQKERLEYVEQREVLVARWKFTTNFYNARDRLDNTIKPNNFESRQVEYLRDFECSDKDECKMSAELRRFLWRGNTILGGSGTQTIKEVARPSVSKERLNRYSRKSTQIISLVDDEDDDGWKNVNVACHLQGSRSAPKQKQVYTYGDTCESLSNFLYLCLADNRQFPEVVDLCEEPRWQA